MQVKRLIIVAAAVALAAGMPAVASAAGWSPLVGGTSPHTGWSTATNYCNQCHAVHEAENAANTINGEYLLRSTAAGSCDYCHVSGTFAITQVYDSDPANESAALGMEHTLGVGMAVPDSNDATGMADDSNDYTIDFTCTSCHTVHGAGAIDFGVPTGTANILKANPLTLADGDKHGIEDTATTQTEFCADCHDNNHVLAHDLGNGVNNVGDQASHIMTSNVDAALASKSSDDCRDCHTVASSIASIGPANNFPHQTVAIDFLMDAYGDGTGVIRLDAVCLDCHGGKVGVSF
ncbi:MAG: hypothetical protein FDZ70_09585 [Actinobacteria bacterium]|nr:MAG: hypothetical protein FDZ70_09585 [Actinomycetota bacterium]